MNIVSLEAENIKRIKAVRIDPKGNLVVIGGNNGQGKTSVLDSIMYALAGKRSVCEQPIRNGEKKGTVKVDLGEYLVTANFTPKTNTVKVQNKDGAQYPSPQALLDGMVGKLSFDPLEFSRMDPKKQLETVRGFLGLDFTEEDAHRKEVYDERSIVARQLKTLKAQLEGMERHGGVAEEEDVSDLTKQYDEAVATQTQITALRGDAAATRGRIARLVERLEEIQIELVRINKMKKEEEELLLSQVVMGKQLVAEAIDPEPIKAKILCASEVARKVRENQLYDRLANDIGNLAQRGTELTKEIVEIDRKKEYAIASTQFPVDGLTFNENGLMFNGVPFSQASSAEQLKVSVAMGIAMNPKLKVLLIRDGSLLDEESLSVVASMAEESDAQVWVERVSKGKECSVIIEDGEVAA